MHVAIHNFANYKSSNKLLLLGDMFELGEYSHDEHQKIVNLLQERKFENVILVGEEFNKLNFNPYLKFKTTSECLSYLKNINIVESTILIKGSRGMKMETLKDVL
jgi:UDP-N-acetylmuramoyl-tripeptide--D-alanyl-D-alanine ligase